MDYNQERVEESQLTQYVHQYTFLDSDCAHCHHLLAFEHTLRLEEGIALYKLIDRLQFVLEDLEVGISEQLLPFRVL